MPVDTAIFDPIAATYDSWYDSQEGRAIFIEEVQCLQHLDCDRGTGWLEVGVGTGRFAEALGIPCGVDLSPEMAAIGRRRGIAAVVGTALQLPFAASSFTGVLMNLTLCFIARPEPALSECKRVLTDNGHLLLGTIPADSPWGEMYAREKAEGHPIYSHAHFRTLFETIALAEQAGFRLQKSHGALFREPGDRPPAGASSMQDVAAPAGFVGLLFAVG